MRRDARSISDVILVFQFVEAHSCHVEIEGGEGLDMCVELCFGKQVRGVRSVAVNNSMADFRIFPPKSSVM